MIRLTRLTDYGIMLLTWFAKAPDGATRSARELAARSRLPQPTVSKLLKLLAHNGMLAAHRGVKGGFSLARPPAEITVADIVTALEGPVAITQCSGHGAPCDVEPTCIVRSNWRKINRVVYEALRQITLADMARPMTLLSGPGEHRIRATLASTGGSDAR